MKKNILTLIIIFFMVMFQSTALAQPPGGLTYDYETIASGPWSSSSTWKNGNIPMIGNTKNIQIKHAVTASGLIIDDYISCAILTIETAASLTVTNTGRISLGGGGSGGTIQCNGTGALSVTSGTVTVWENSGVINGGYAGSATVENIVIEGTNVELPNVTITGTLTIKYNGSVAATSFSGYPQYGASSTLVYDCGNTDFKVIGKEWKSGTASGAGVPKNVSFSGSKVTLGAGSDYCQMTGNLSIDGTSTLQLANELKIGGNFSIANGGAFTHNSGTVTFNGSADQTITLMPTTSAVEFYHVTVNKSSGKLNLAASAQMTVKGNLTMTKGNIAVGEYAVFLVDDGVIMSASAASLISGKLSIKRTFGSSFTLVYPVGYDTVYRPVTLYVEQSNPQYGVTMVNSAPTGTADGTTVISLSQKRYWIVNKEADGPTRATIKLIYYTNDGISNASYVRIAAVEPGPFGSTYSSIGPTPSEIPGPVASGELTSDYLTSLPNTYNVVIGNAPGGSNPLPVELNSFTASATKNGVTLNWKTATETNNYGFEIQRSVVSSQQSGNVWSKIGFVEGNGTTNAPKSYSFTDKSANGKTSYRLKQIDRDGKLEYSQTVEIIAATVPKEFGLEQNYPNPFNPTTAIGYQLSANGFTSLKVYDAIGREVATLVNEVKDAGYYSAQFNGAKLSSGIYFAKLTSDRKTQMKKLLLLK